MNRSLLAFAPAILLAWGASVGAEQWPQWRGPAQNGVSAAQNLPATWSESENIVWKKKLPSWSGGTPVVWGERIFYTSPNFGEKTEGGEKLLLGCLSSKDGSVLWQRELARGNAYLRKHNNTSPSPVTNGEVVCAISGTGVLHAFDMEGEGLWHRDLQKEYGAFGHMWGYASSPLLHGDKVFVEVLHGMNTDDPSYVVAFDLESGAEKWRVERETDAVGESPDAYTTPVVLKHDGQEQIVISGGDYITAHAPESGKELWRASGLNPNKEQNYRVVGSPIAIDGMVYAPTRRTPLLALRAGGSGDISESHLVWKYEGKGAPDVPSPATDGQYLYLVDDRGRATCLDAKSGKVLWGPERTEQGNVSASPVLADGKIYIVNEEATTTVLVAGPEYEVLATNRLDGGYTLSSPAIAGGRIFLRTKTHLYCIGAAN